MYINVRITAVADRDPSCNLLTYTEDHRFSIAMPPTPDKVRELLAAHKERFFEMWPHHRNAKPHLVPLDVEITERDGSSDD
jgi:hypothetical protein